MKLLFAVGILALVALSTAKPQKPVPYPNPDSKPQSPQPSNPTPVPIKNLFPNGCIYIQGKCHHGCADGTHDYHTFCSQKMPEATCDQPNPVLERGNVCDFSACYCNAPTVRDTSSGKCVPLEECPKK